MHILLSYVFHFGGMTLLMLWSPIHHAGMTLADLRVRTDGRVFTTQIAWFGWGISGWACLNPPLVDVLVWTLTLWPCAGLKGAARGWRTRGRWQTLGQLMDDVSMSFAIVHHVFVHDVCHISLGFYYEFAIFHHVLSWFKPFGGSHWSYHL